jgi:FlaA1/EpsC-like NDP-sugar epimerase
MIVQCRKDSKTVFSAVRFGNVLASSGSVIPLFKKQILLGGPVTITDKRVVRYFMTIREAVNLVTEAGAFAGAGELLVLDMGEPVRIYDLAIKMIKLSGLVPFKDVDVTEVGLRPGEKLYEEMLTGKDTQTKTRNDMIFIERDTPISREDVDEKMRVLKDALTASESELSPLRITEALKEIVPTFRSPDEVNTLIK